jgi:hypothetical protein
MPLISGNGGSNSGKTKFLPFFSLLINRCFLKPAGKHRRRFSNVPGKYF